MIQKAIFPVTPAAPGAERCREAEGGLRDVTILEVERCREAEGAQRESRGSRCAERCQEARDGLRDVARLQVG